MPRSVNKWHGIGHLARDASQKFTTSGQSIASFTLACGRKWKDKQSGEWKEDVAWVPIVMWGNENVVQYLLKGKPLYVEGRINTRSYDDKDGRKVYVTEIIAEDVILLGGDKRDDERPTNGVVSMPRQRAQVQESPQHVTDDDIPF